MESLRDCCQVLLIEDNPGDVGLIRRAFAHTGRPTRLQVMHDGPEALCYLRGLPSSVRGDSAGFRRPDLILLDLSLPKMDGCEVLAQIRQEPGLAAIPVIILSSSQAEPDILRSYAHAANCFITKPLDVDKYLAVIGSVQQFWLARAGAARGERHD
jgi:CheY-like chemotaxis protein